MSPTFLKNEAAFPQVLDLITHSGSPCRDLASFSRPPLASPPSVAYVAYVGLKVLLVTEIIMCLKSKACAYESRSHPDQLGKLHYV